MPFTAVDLTDVFLSQVQDLCMVLYRMSIGQQTALAFLILNHEATAG